MQLYRAYFEGLTCKLLPPLCPCRLNPLRSSYCRSRSCHCSRQICIRMWFIFKVNRPKKSAKTTGMLSSVSICDRRWLIVIGWITMEIWSMYGKCMSSVTWHVFKDAPTFPYQWGLKKQKIYFQFAYLKNMHRNRWVFLFPLFFQLCLIDRSVFLYRSFIKQNVRRGPHPTRPEKLVHGGK